MRLPLLGLVPPFMGLTNSGTRGATLPDSSSFWPVVWAMTTICISSSTGCRTILPSGVLSTAIFSSNRSDGTIFRILSDNATVSTLIPYLNATCASLFNTSTLYHTSFGPSEDRALDGIKDASSLPPPQQVIQYYRASSIALSIDGYNNTVIFAPGDAAPDVPLPNGINTVGTLSLSR